MENTSIKKERITPRNGVQIVVEREFVGAKSLAEVFIPIIYEDILRQTERAHTIDIKSA